MVPKQYALQMRKLKPRLAFRAFGASIGTHEWTNSRLWLPEIVGPDHH